MVLNFKLLLKQLLCKFSDKFEYSKAEIGLIVLSLFDMKRYTYIFMIIALSIGSQVRGQEKIGNGLEIDKIVHNFGDIILKSGPVSCEFNVKNTGSKPAVIYNVTSSCGCTDVQWTREPLMPGKTGKISVTYSNDEGAYPFDKNLTVYFSDIKKPVILKVRGVSVEKKKPLAESYPIHFGNLGMKGVEFKCGNLEQGGQKSDAVMVANISDKPVTVDFENVSKNLSLSVSPNPIPAQSTAEMRFTVTASSEIWGKNYYYASPVLNGKSAKTPKGDSQISIWAFTKENFSSLSDDEKAKGPRPMFMESTYSFGKVKKGDTVHAEFTFKNEGTKDFCVYRVNADACCWSHSDIPVAAPGKSVTFRVHVDTKDMPLGETLTIVTLTTNSPLRPIVNLFIAGWIE